MLESSGKVGSDAQSLLSERLQTTRHVEHQKNMFEQEKIETDFSAAEAREGAHAFDQPMLRRDGCRAARQNILSASLLLMQTLLTDLNTIEVLYHAHSAALLIRKRWLPQCTWWR